MVRRPRLAGLTTNGGTARPKLDLAAASTDEPHDRNAKSREPSPGRNPTHPSYQNAWRMPMCSASLLPLLPGAAWLVAPVRA